MPIRWLEHTFGVFNWLWFLKRMDDVDHANQSSITLNQIMTSNAFTITGLHF